MNFVDSFLNKKNKYISGDKMRNEKQTDFGVYYFIKKAFPSNKNKTVMLNKHIPFSTFILEKVDKEAIEELIERNNEILEHTKDW